MARAVPSHNGDSVATNRLTVWALAALALLGAAAVIALAAGGSAGDARDRLGAPALLAASLWIFGLLVAAGVAWRSIDWCFPSAACRLRNRARQMRPQIVLSLASFALALVAAEVGVRWFWPTPPLPWIHDSAHQSFQANDWQGLFCEFDPVLGWRGVAGREGWFVRPSFRVWVSQNTTGFRDIEHPPGGQTNRRLAFLGDSFLWGCGVDQHATITAQLRRFITDADIYNLGVCGYGTDQSLLNLQQHMDSLNPTWVCYLFCSNDLFDNQSDFKHGHAKPRFAVEPGGLRLEPVPSTAALQPAARPEQRDSAPPPSLASLLANPARSLSRTGDYFLSPHSMLYRRARQVTLGWQHRVHPLSLDPLTQALVLDMKRICEQRGARFTAALIPDRPVLRSAQPEEYYADVRQWCSDHAVDCLDLTRALSDAGLDAYLFEGHWSPLGHKVTALALAKHLQSGATRRKDEG